jgi:hypothetical protein
MRWKLQTQPTALQQTRTLSTPQTLTWQRIVLQQTRTAPMPLTLIWLATQLQQTRTLATSASQRRAQRLDMQRSMPVARCQLGSCHRQAQA